MRYQYDLSIATPRRLTPDELERVTRAALDELAAICNVPADASRQVEHRVLAPAPRETKAA